MPIDVGAVIARGAQRLVLDFGKINSDTRFAVVTQLPRQSQAACEQVPVIARGAQRLVLDFGKINSDTRFAVVRQSPAAGERPVKLLMQSN